ncbi:MAG TPA: TonB-dependent receptor [Blastocatellia bacterium]|nr:TonB-dependent receptor [Blastocatellia bacterium]
MLKPLKHILQFIVIASIAVAAIQSAALAQTTEPIRIAPITVYVYKEKDDAQRLPVSVTGVSESVLRSAGVIRVSDAGILAPNTFFSEFTARKLSNARFRGIGSSPLNPGITTYIDGVPQLNTNSSNIEFVDIEQVEFVREPQSALFGRNTLGGLINITTERPSLTEWKGGVTTSLANRSEWDARAGISGPISDKVGIRVTAGHGARDGFTINDVTGNDLDYRRTSYGKAQLWWTPTSKWEARLIVTGQRDQDGDYGLNDLAALRRNPFHSSRNFEGIVERDILSPTVQIRYEGSRFAFGATSGLVSWKTRDVTDLDYTAGPFIVRDNKEKDVQFTQELRFASAPGAPARLGDGVRLRWQTGVFFFSQNYDQDAINNFAPFLLSPQLGFPVAQHSPRSALNDKGVGVYGQVTATFKENFDLTFGARVDHENKEANLRTFFDPAISPENRVIAEKAFSNVSPQMAASYRFAGSNMVYASVGRGYKAGGFNPTSPVASEAFGEEKTWHVESGVKTLLAGGKLSANASLFYIDWSGLQLNVPNPAVPAQFFIRNIGSATSKGFEAELNVRPHANVDLFATYGFTNARFADNTSSGGVDVSGKKLPSAPDHTFTVGAQLSKDLNKSLMLYGRGEVWVNGGFEYNDANTERQKAFSLTNFRVGLRGRYAFVEGWIKNAFDTKYIPIAFPFGGFAPSGFLGEMGPPRRAGVTMGVTF